jgi:hypothetical protein
LQLIFVKKKLPRIFPFSVILKTNKSLKVLIK